MTAIRKCLVSKYGSLSYTTPKETILTFSRVVSYESFANGDQTLLYYSNSSNTQNSVVYLDESYATFNTAYEQRTSDVGVPLFTISKDTVPQNREMIFSTQNIVTCILNPAGDTSTVMYTNPNGTSGKAIIQGDLDDIIAAAYDPSTGITDGVMRTGEFTSLVGETTVTFDTPFEVGSTVFVQLSDIEAVGYDDDIVATATGFTFTATAAGAFSYIAVKTN